MMVSMHLKFVAERQPCESSFSTNFLISMFCQYNLGARQYNFLDSDVRNGPTLFITITRRNVN